MLFYMQLKQLLWRYLEITLQNEVPLNIVTFHEADNFECLDFYYETYRVNNISSYNIKSLLIIKLAYIKNLAQLLTGICEPFITEETVMDFLHKNESFFLVSKSWVLFVFMTFLLKIQNYCKDMPYLTSPIYWKWELWRQHFTFIYKNKNKPKSRSIKSPHTRTRKPEGKITSFSHTNNKETK